MSGPSPGDRRVFTLRPAGESGSLLAALHRRGAPATNIAVFRLCGTAPADAAVSMQLALSATRVLFSSPAAVRHAQRIDHVLALGWFAPQGALAACAVNGGVFAPGPGTGTALHRAGIHPVQLPASRFDSEGILALPALAEPISGTFALVNAPDGRGLLETALTERGARVFPVHVYRRENETPDPASLQSLLDSDSPTLIVSSGSALDRLMSLLATSSLARLQASAHVVVASERLSEHAATLGFRHRFVARSAQVDDLVAAIDPGRDHAADTSAKDDSVSMTT